MRINDLPFFLADDLEEKSIWRTFLDWIVNEGLKLLLGFVILFLLFKLINIIAKLVNKQLERRKVEKTYSRVIYEVIRKGSKLALLVVFLAYIGIEASSVAAIIASLGVGIGLALQGALSNFAGGLLIIFTRTIRIGDFIETSNIIGTVEDIHLFYTHIATPDNKVVILPNGALANGIIVNFSIKHSRRAEFEFVIPAINDASEAKEIIRQSCANNALILSSPEPFIVISKISGNAVTLLLRIWCRNADYWTLYFSLTGIIGEELTRKGYANPVNKMNINIEK